MGNRLLTPSKIISGLKQPRLALSRIRSRRGRQLLGRELNQAFHSRFWRRKYNPAGIDIFNEDWDNLVILDACRYDAFKRSIQDRDLPDEVSGQLESRTSRGAQTPEWLYANFHDRELSDVVYITAASMLYQLTRRNVTNPSPKFKKYSLQTRLSDVIDLWNKEKKMSDEESNAGIVFPEKMTSLTKRIAKKYPNKRLLIHYTQPHDPYLGPTAMELFDETIGDTDEQLGHQFAQNPWRAWVKGDLETTPATLRKAYQENVDMALDAALDLCSHLSGKTVISADHGEHLYDRSKPIPTREIRHPDKIYTPKLVKVPWFEINGERRCIRESETVSLGQTGSERGDERAAEQLEALGYRK